MKTKYNISLFFLIVVCFLVTGNYRSNTASDSEYIPQERIDFDGTYSENGLAKRVIKELKEDEILSALMTNQSIYVAQNGSTIILKGEVPDKYTMHRVVNIAKKVEGGTNIDLSQITINFSQK